MLVSSGSRIHYYPLTDTYLDASRARGALVHTTKLSPRQSIFAHLVIVHCVACGSALNMPHYVHTLHTVCTLPHTKYISPSWLLRDPFSIVARSNKKSFQANSPGLARGKALSAPVYIMGVQGASL